MATPALPTTTKAPAGTAGGLASVLTSTAGQLNGGTANGNGLGSALASMATMAASGAALGPVGAAAGAALGLLTSLGGLLGGHGAPDHERPDLNTIAAANDITADEASAVCAYKEQHVRDNYDAICARAARDRGYFQGLLGEYNAAHPGGEIKTKAVQVQAQYAQLQAQAATMFTGSGQSSPLANLTLPQVQAAASAQNMTLADYLKAILNGALGGAQAGAGDAAAETPFGKQLTWESIKGYAKKYQLVIAFGVVGFIWLCKRAFRSKLK